MDRIIRKGFKTKSSVHGKVAIRYVNMMILSLSRCDLLLAGGLIIQFKSDQGSSPAHSLHNSILQPGLDKIAGM